MSKSFLKVIVLANLLVAPIPKATVAILWTANAFIKGILNNNNIAGNWITPAPPPENAEKIFEIIDIAYKQSCSNKLLPSYHCAYTFICK
jgi:hypothetical protein